MNSIVRGRPRRALVTDRSKFIDDGETHGIDHNSSKGGFQCVHPFFSRRGWKPGRHQMTLPNCANVEGRIAVIVNSRRNEHLADEHNE